MSNEDKFNLDKFAEDMSQPWTCCRCKRTFTPQPDDPDSFPVGVMTKFVPSTVHKGDFLEKKVGDICGNCMRSPAPAQGGLIL